jgi:hypothetical protein
LSNFPPFSCAERKGFEVVLGLLFSLRDDGCLFSVFFVFRAIPVWQAELCTLHTQNWGKTTVEKKDEGEPLLYAQYGVL